MPKSRENSISLKFSNNALKFFEKLNKKDQAKIWNVIEKIRADPLVGKPLTGVKELRKIRARDYRVVYIFQKNELRILVVKIGHRKDVYKDLN